MDGAKAVAMKSKQPRSMSTIQLTPQRAAELLEHNKVNRPISDSHVSRLERQITQGKWRFNGDTIKISEDGDVLDGQHRLWAVMGAKKPIETIVVNGIAREAFATIDTLRKPRSGADVLALSGAERYRNITASALQWLIRYQRGAISSFRDPKNRVENSDIEESYAAHPGIARAVERCMGLRSMVNPAIIAFLYYVLTNKNEYLAERMVETLENPAGVPVSDPFFRLRSYLTMAKHKQRIPIVTIALAIKSINAAYKDEKIQTLSWRNQGTKPEAFPALLVK